MNTNAVSRLPPQLVKENGGGGFVSIWREGDLTDSVKYGITVGGWLLMEENQSGSWYIDGGWGGPPGPIRVDWDDEQQLWINKGFWPW